MKRFWAPWRMKFILDSKRGQDCILCSLLKQKDGLENLILARLSDSYIVLNKYPYNPGHIMVVPNEHGADFTKLSPTVLSSIHSQLQKAVSVLQNVYQPAGFNIGMNLGAEAGAGIPDHLHYHIVPRWKGDTNFMPVIAETKVLPETVEETYNKLKSYFI